MLPENYMIVMVGLTKEQKTMLPANILGLEATKSQEELAMIYSTADILLSLSSCETFGMTMAEAFACGTPVIAYNNTAQPEIVTGETGIVVQEKNLNAVVGAIETIISKSSNFNFGLACRHRAEQLYNRDVNNNDYIMLYKTLLQSKC